MQLYEPAMLIVGTRGRSLGGFQGLVSNRNSFSKWCLQYSPIPVVVVRPPEKRDKKKLKRANDPSRQNYVQILQESSQGTHEASADSAGNIKDVEFLPRNTPEIEAHEVAAAMSLPARFDPTLKPIDFEGSHRRASNRSDATSTSLGSASPESGPSSPLAVMKSRKSTQLESPAASDAESDSEDDGEFEAVPGHMLLKNTQGDAVEKQKRLHQMEVGEAAALAAARKLSTGSNDSNAFASGEPEDGDEEG
jgi:hypothetical protein